MSDMTDKNNWRIEKLLGQAEMQLPLSKSTKKSDHNLGFDQLLHELRVQKIELEMQNEELRRAHLALETSRAYYYELYDFAPIGYLTLNAEGLIVEINFTAAKLFGEERKDLINRLFFQFISDDYKDLWYRHFQLAKQDTVTYGCELPTRRDNGAILYIHLDCLYKRSDDGSSLLRVTLTDVSERRRAEEAQYIAAAAFETQDGIIVSDADNIILRVNRSFSRITGYSVEEAIGKGPYFLRSDQHTEDFYEAIWASVKCNGFWQGEIWEKRKDGQNFLMWLTLTAVKGADGHITHYVGSFMDITERKQAETDLRIAAAAFDAQDGIIVADARKVILRINRAFTRITGYRDEDVIGKNSSILRSGLHDGDIYRVIWAAVRQNGFWQGEIWDKRKNGEIFPVMQTISAVFGEDGAITHYVGILSDITAQKQAEKVLLDARERLENQVVTTKEELENIKTETEEINMALNVLLKHRETDKSEAQISLSQEVEATVLPLLKRLKMASTGRIKSTKLIDILENNLQLLVKSYGRAANLAAAYQLLTPLETQVASMVRQGLATKSIASSLNISAGTVDIHRKHIRKKLGLNGKATNLQSYLGSLAE
jgi:PAS domain S-box-containing protein